MSELSQQFMALLIQLSVALLAIIASAISHYRILQYLTKFIVRLRNGARGLIVLFCGIAASQLLAALWFTFAFKVSIAIDLGNLKGGSLNQFIELFYFSLINLTTL
ncbi:MAG: transporter, partial [Alteromonas sp.]|nr:transporter [Alteromonas sp.]